MRQRLSAQCRASTPPTPISSYLPAIRYGPSVRTTEAMGKALDAILAPWPSAAFPSPPFWQPRRRGRCQQGDADGILSDSWLPRSCRTISTGCETITCSSGRRTGAARCAISGSSTPDLREKGRAKLPPVRQDQIDWVSGNRRRLPLERGWNAIQPTRSSTSCPGYLRRDGHRSVSEEERRGQGLRLP